MTYTVPELLDRLYNTLGNNEKKEIIIIKPCITKEYQMCRIRNYTEMCKNINRNKQHLKEFIEDELSLKTKISGDGILYFRGKYTQESIERIYKHYICKYVKCNSCKSYDTSIKKIKKLNKLICNFCHASQVL